MSRTVFVNGLWWLVLLGVSWLVVAVIVMAVR